MKGDKMFFLKLTLFFENPIPFLSSKLLTQHSNLKKKRCPAKFLLSTHDSQLTTHASQLTSHDSRLTTHDSRLTTHKKKGVRRFFS